MVGLFWKTQWVGGGKMVEGWDSSAESGLKEQDASCAAAADQVGRAELKNLECQ